MKPLIRVSKSVIGPAERKSVERILTGEFLGTGPETRAFERELERYLGGGVRAICVSSGTAALHLAVQACDIGSGNEILVPSMTYLASFQAISATGAKPVSCDVFEDSGLLDLHDAERRITAKTKAVMPVHYGGHVGNLDAVYEFAGGYGLRVIEDAAHAFGTTYQGKRIGSFGDIVCFSFDGVKNITSGEGGAVVTKDPDVIRKVEDARLLAVMGDSDMRHKRERSWEFDVREQGWRYHMSDIMAAIGRAQLLRFEKQLKPKRVQLHKYYRRVLPDIDGISLFETDINHVVPHIMPIRVLHGKRDRVRKNLADSNIETGIHYKPNHLLSYYGGGNTKLHVSERLYKELLTLPLHPDLGVDDLEYIREELLTALE